MNIAIIIPGHLRYWIDCKDNFLEKIYDQNHNIDVYIDTYTTIFRSDAIHSGESAIKQFLNFQQIKNLFDKINVVDFKFDDEDKDKTQEKKLQSVYESVLKSNKKYDLMVRTRFDLLLEDKLDYEFIYNECVKNPKLIFIGKGGDDGLLNDMFAVCLPESFDLYVNRFKYGDVEKYEGIHHGSLKQISRHHGIIYNTDAWIHLKRPNGKIYKMGI